MNPQPKPPLSPPLPRYRARRVGIPNGKPPAKLDAGGTEDPRVVLSPLLYRCSPLSSPLSLGIVSVCADGGEPGHRYSSAATLPHSWRTRETETQRTYHRFPTLTHSAPVVPAEAVCRYQRPPSAPYRPDLPPSSRTSAISVARRFARMYITQRG